MRSKSDRSLLITSDTLSSLSVWVLLKRREPEVVCPDVAFGVYYLVVGRRTEDFTVPPISPVSPAIRTLFGLWSRYKTQTSGRVLTKDLFLFLLRYILRSLTYLHGGRFVVLLSASLFAFLYILASYTHIHTYTYTYALHAYATLSNSSFKFLDIHISTYPHPHTFPIRNYLCHFLLQCTSKHTGGVVFVLIVWGRMYSIFILREVHRAPVVLTNLPLNFRM